jgi:FkbM family methyltransferase
LNAVVPTLPRPTSRHAAIAARRELEQHARQGHQAVYIGDHTVLCRVLGKYMCYVDTLDRGLAPHLILNGFWEPWITLAIERLLEPGMVCIDVGANLGYYTALMADAVGPGGAVIAFEPNPRLSDLARASMFLNGFASRTCISEYAAADRDGRTVHLSFSPEMPMNGTICSEGTPADAVPVQTVTLDTACAGLGRLDLIKIDAEGAEQAVWDGMQGLLDRHPGAAVVLEWNAKRGEAERLLDKIASRFPTLRHIDFDGEVVEIGREQLLTERGHEDFMLMLRRD